ncbi:FGGY-family carbohydrate kinase [Tropicimonas sp. TH_r6]|nr:FGGY-family carbohydrate kinase [Tropicimonas sp. TH_r6]MDV7142554.1 FGGY-family carbohydrate kinase [Tropicimonas sp. TH_r6]
MFSELKGAARYEAMIAEAEAAPEDCHGLFLDPDLLIKKGAMNGLSLDVDRGTIYRAALTGLVRRLKTGLATLETAGNFHAEELTLVGGGTRNQFWTQLKANALGIPVRTLDEPEVTVLGAAMVAFWGVGLFGSPEEARQHFNLPSQVTFPAG